MAPPDFTPNDGIKVGPFGMFVAETPVHAAAKNGHDEVVKALLSHEDVDPNVGMRVGPRGALKTSTPVQVASRVSQQAIIRTLRLRAKESSS